MCVSTYACVCVCGLFFLVESTGVLDVLRKVNVLKLKRYKTQYASKETTLEFVLPYFFHGVRVSDSSDCY